MTKFKNIAELRSERAKLYLKMEFLENEIKEDFEELKESLRPINLIKDLFSSDKKEGDENSVSPVVSNIGSTILDLIISKFFFKKTSYIKKILSSYLIHSTGPTVIQKYGPTVISSIKKLFKGFVQRENNSKPVYDESTTGHWHEA